MTFVAIAGRLKPKVKTELSIVVLAVAVCTYIAFPSSPQSHVWERDKAARHSSRVTTTMSSFRFVAYKRAFFLSVHSS